MTKHIGIVACSAEGASLCYRTICIEGENFLGKHGHPEIEENSDRDGVKFGNELDDKGLDWDLMKKATFWCLKK